MGLERESATNGAALALEIGRQMTVATSSDLPDEGSAHLKRTRGRRNAAFCFSGSSSENRTFSAQLLGENSQNFPFFSAPKRPFWHMHCKKGLEAGVKQLEFVPCSFEYRSNDRLVAVVHQSSLSSTAVESSRARYANRDYDSATFYFLFWYGWRHEQPFFAHFSMRACLI